MKERREGRNRRKVGKRRREEKRDRTRSKRERERELFRILPKPRVRKLVPFS